MEKHDNELNSALLLLGAKIVDSITSVLKLVIILTAACFGMNLLMPKLTDCGYIGYAVLIVVAAIPILAIGLASINEIKLNLFGCLKIKSKGGRKDVT